MKIFLDVLSGQSSPFTHLKIHSRKLGKKEESPISRTQQLPLGDFKGISWNNAEGPGNNQSSHCCRGHRDQRMKHSRVKEF